METAQKKESAKWEVESLRFTGFPIPSYDFVNNQWWNDVLDQPPDTVITQPKTMAKHIEWIFGVKKLVLEVTQQRIDWLIMGDNQNSPIAFMNTIGEFKDIRIELFDHIHRWLDSVSVPDFQRIAFGAVLLETVENKIAGYERIQSFLPDVRLDPEGSTDFLYQINRPRPSKTGIPELKINRLSKWSVAKSFLFSFSPDSVRLDQGLQKFACRLELDINTAADFNGVISREKLDSLIEELTQLGEEISYAGDIP